MSNISNLPRTLLSAFATLFLLSGCRAPGMKFKAQVDDKVTVQMGRQQVTLRPLDAKAVQEFGSPVSTSSPYQDLLSAKTEPYRIGPQDILLITVWDHPEITLPLGQYRTDAATGMVVDEEGLLYFPYIGRVAVGGQTVSQVRETLTSKLSRVLQKPQVDVKVLAFRSQKVHVGGEVRNPAAHNITDVPFTLGEALNRAGGFLPTADQSRVAISRGDQTWSINALELFAQGNRMGQIQLKNGDSVHVHHREESQVYLMGEVRNARSVPTLNGRISLAQALSEAGGINTLTASAKSIYVLRRGRTDSAVDVFHLDAYNPVAMVMADRFTLLPRDMVFVDAGTLVRWNRVVGLLLPTTSLLSTVPTVAADSKTAWQ